MSELTYGDIITFFEHQFSGLKVDDIRPNGPNTIFVWIKDSPYHLIATYRPETKTFMAITTTQGWGDKND